jgi:hypothetical protein
MVAEAFVVEQGGELGALVDPVDGFPEPVGNDQHIAVGLVEGAQHVFGTDIFLPQEYIAGFDQGRRFGCGKNVYQTVADQPVGAEGGSGIFAHDLAHVVVEGDSDDDEGVIHEFHVFHDAHHDARYPYVVAGHQAADICKMCLDLETGSKNALVFTQHIEEQDQQYQSGEDENAQFYIVCCAVSHTSSYKKGLNFRVG